jgi:Dolichyl-phosphate-mannose-protein mannosyltransferase
LKRSPKKNAKRKKKAIAERQSRLHRYWVFTVIAVVILFSGAIRLRLLDFPLERDEGEYAYAGQLILHGVPPYLQAYNMKLPGVYATYALIMALFGQTIGGIHLGLILVNSASIVLVFLLAKRLFDPLAGLVACASFAILSISPSVLGVAAHATHFVALSVLGGTLLLSKATDTRSRIMLFLSGLLFGLAFVMKQPGIFFVVFGGLYLLGAEVRARPIEWGTSITRVALFALGAVVPFGLTCLILAAAGVFQKFWFWTFSYASQYVSEVPAPRAFGNFWRAVHGVPGPAVWLWALAAIGLIFLWWDKSIREKAAFVTGFLIFSFLAVIPGFYFREHYFIVLLPAVALLTGAAVSFGRNLLQRIRALPAVQLWLPVALFLSAFGYSIIQQKEFLFELSPEMACRTRYPGNPFSESIEIAKYIKANSAPSDRIAVIGSEPQIYFYSDRRSATGYIYTYGLMEEQKYALNMQQEMISQIEAVRPKYLVYVDVGASWIRRSNSSMLMFQWYAQYRQNYDLVGIADILSKDETVYRWGDDAKNYVPRSGRKLYVYRLKKPV